jgi:cytolysin-activating lysine-acyltransferase
MSAPPDQVAVSSTPASVLDKELLAGGMRLKPTEWKSGDRLWLMELIAPSLVSDAEQAAKLLATVAREVFGSKPFKMFRLNPETRLPETVEVSASRQATEGSEAK